MFMISIDGAFDLGRCAGSSEVAYEAGVLQAGDDL